MSGGKDYVCSLLPNIHDELSPPPDTKEIQLVKGDYLFYHYGCDGFDDRGWGCGYRTLMSLCSWVRGQLVSSLGTVASVAAVPSNREIQELLVQIGDKESGFVGSRNWIGSVEVAMVIEALYGIQSKIIHVSSGQELKDHVETLFEHFRTKGSPIMMGGDTDASSKGIVGICRSNNVHLLIVDPHYWGEAQDKVALASGGWVKWQPLENFHQTSFYNLCLPQHASLAIKSESRTAID